MPGPPMAAAAAAKGGGALASMGSSFLTGASAALGSMVGGSNSMSGSKARRINRYQIQNSYKYGFKPQMRLSNQYWKEQQQWYRRNIAKKQIQDRVRDAKNAGVHPLVAMGLAPYSGGPAPAAPSAPTGSMPNIGGDNTFGNAIEHGINTAMSHRDAMEARAHGRAMANLQVEEQALRNDWLRQQIANSRRKSLASAVNSQQDAVKLTALKNAPHENTITVTPEPGYKHASKSTGYNLLGFDIKQRPGKLTVEGAEDAMGEPGAWAYSPFSILQDIGYTLDQKYFRDRKWEKPPRSTRSFSDRSRY